MYTNSLIHQIKQFFYTILNGWGLHTIDSETPSHTYLKKMSFYYRGRSNPVDTCEKVMPGQSKYPTVAYKEYFNIPIKDNIDLSSALDEETGAVFFIYIYFYFLLHYLNY